MAIPDIAPEGAAMPPMPKGRAVVLFELWNVVNPPRLIGVEVAVADVHGFACPPLACPPGGGGGRLNEDTADVAPCGGGIENEEVCCARFGLFCCSGGCELSDMLDMEGFIPPEPV
jgi:hypothetical protein